MKRIQFSLNSNQHICKKTSGESHSLHSSDSVVVQAEMMMMQVSELRSALFLLVL